MSTEEIQALSNTLYWAESDDFRRGYNRGWDDAALEQDEKDESFTPPWFRRYFWYPMETFCEDSRPRFGYLSHDDHCNPLLGVRLRGGVLNIRYGRKVRTAKDGLCRTCRSEDESWRHGNAG